MENRTLRSWQGESHKTTKSLRQYWANPVKHMPQREENSPLKPNRDAGIMAQLAHTHRDTTAYSSRGWQRKHVNVQKYFVIYMWSAHKCNPRVEQTEEAPSK